MKVHERAYEGPADLRRMQRLVQEAWALRGPAWAQHVGDLAWGRFQHVGREPEWRTQLWEDDGRVVAYAWLFEGDVLDFCVHPERPDLLDAVLGWADARETDALDANTDAIAALERHGYERASDDEPWFAYLARGLRDLPEPELADGFTLRTVGEGDVESRVEAHRCAWHPSRMSLESYRYVMMSCNYIADL
jgi:hypothetical protein